MNSSIHSETVDVLIVGATLSGLCAAYRLAKAGRSVIMLEAQDGAGAQTLSPSFQGTSIDLGMPGAGSQQPTLLQLAQELGVKSSTRYRKGKKIVEIGDKISTYSGASPSLSLPGYMDLKWTVSRLERLCKQVPLDAPHQALRAEEWNQMSVAAFQNEQMWTKEGRARLDTLLRSLFAAEPDDLSMLYFLWYLHRNGGWTKLMKRQNTMYANRWEGGQAQLLLRLADRVEASGQRLLRNALVQSIRQDNDKVYVESTAGTFIAQKAIIALPPVQANKIDFQAPLPQARQQLHKNLSTGDIIKVIAVYPTPFWRAQGYSGEVLSHSNPLQLAFDDSPEDASFGAIGGLLLGNSARQWANHSDKTLQAMVVGELVRYFGMDAANPIAFFRQNWQAETCSDCDYPAYVAPTVLIPDENALRQPFGRIHWAEAEIAIPGLNSWDSAVEAGEKVATEVLQMT